MAKNKIFLHVGPEPRALTHADLTDHRALLAGAGCLVPQIAPSALDAAATEMLRNHRSLGLRRRDVEGAWAGITRNLWRLGTDLVISQPQFAEATAEQFHLVQDHLAGLELHVVALAGAEAHHLLPAWLDTLPAERVHVRDIDSPAEAIDLAEVLTGVIWSVRRQEELATRSRPLLRTFSRRRRTPAVA